MRLSLMLLLAAAGCGLSGKAETALTFRQAEAVWIEGWADAMNRSAEFSAEFEVQPGERPMLRLTGAQAYRVRVNGAFVHYGPARAPKGFARLDEVPLAPFVKAGRNDLTIEVAGYRVNSYYLPNTPGFLQAEIVVGDRVAVATPRDFTAVELPRVQKVTRYSFQRPFGEVWRLPAGNRAPLKLVPSAYGREVRLLPRRVELPDFSLTAPFAPEAALVRRFDPKASVKGNRFVDGIGPDLLGFPRKELEVNTYAEIQRTKVTRKKGEAPIPAARYQLTPSAGVLFAAPGNETGFFVMDVEVTQAPARLMLAFDEVLIDGVVSPLRYDCNNTVVWEFAAPGRYRFESFEPYTLRFVEALETIGEIAIAAPRLRRYRNPCTAAPRCPVADPALEAIWEAAKTTFAQNAVDVMSDCPGRERAGWLCDSFFTARVGWLMTGSNALETLFIENYALPERFEGIPEGMLPMCYPADHPNGCFIPNWAMWFVLELDEYVRLRHGDPALIARLRPRIEQLVEFFVRRENADGLLERLPGWVFVEWSKANDYVQDVNYPSNMAYAGLLDAVARLYGRPDLQAKAAKIRETIRRQSFDGVFFHDHAVRDSAGQLVVKDDITETCQYYAFYFGVATREAYPTLWRTLVEDCGPGRKVLQRHPQVAPSNAFIGNYLRLELLSQAGLGAQIDKETRGFFTYMVERTGTLWEHDSTSASCCHGFASHAAVLIQRDLAAETGMRENRP